MDWKYTRTSFIIIFSSAKNEYNFALGLIIVEQFSKSIYTYILVTAMLCQYNGFISKWKQKNGVGKLFHMP